jgi:hypothetical protein
MSHKFTLGQAVMFSPGAREVLCVTSVCEITRLMPMEGAEYQYDIRVESDGRLRRALEHQLRPMSRHGVWG